LIRSPALSVFGVSTADEFHAALQGESVDNGFLNRYLVLESSLRVADRDPEMTPGQVPAALKAGLHARYLWSGPQSLLRIDDPEVAFVPDVLPWAGEPAKDCYSDFGHVTATQARSRTLQGAARSPSGSPRSAPPAASSKDF